MHSNSINTEIARFLDKYPQHNLLYNNPPSPEVDPTTSSINELITLLSPLESLYRDIKSLLETSSADTSIFNRKVESTLICDSFIKVLKEVSIERNAKSKEVEDLKSQLEKTQEIKDRLMVATNKLNELQTIYNAECIKNKEMKSNLEEQGRKCSDLLLVNKELESINANTKSKIEIQNKELKIMGEHLSDNKIKGDKMEGKFTSMENVISDYKKK